MSPKAFRERAAEIIAKRIATVLNDSFTDSEIGELLDEVRDETVNDLLNHLTKDVEAYRR